MGYSGVTQITATNTLLIHKPTNRVATYRSTITRDNAKAIILNKRSNCDSLFKEKLNDKAIALTRSALIQNDSSRDNMILVGVGVI